MIRLSGFWKSSSLPAIAPSSVVIPKGSFQAENGFLITKDPGRNKCPLFFASFARTIRRVRYSSLRLGGASLQSGAKAKPTPATSRLRSLRPTARAKPADADRPTVLKISA